jgi:hypothetical protein
MLKVVSLFFIIAGLIYEEVFVCLIKIQMKTLLFPSLLIVLCFTFLSAKKQQNIIHLIKAITSLVREFNHSLDSNNSSNDEDI